MNLLSGKKTYISAILLVVYGLVGIYLGKATWDQEIGYIIAAANIASLRAAIAKVTPTSK